MRTLDQAIAQLRRTTKHLPAALRQRLVAAGSDAVPGLLEVLEDRAGWRHDAPGGGWPPIHAVEVLRDIGDARAVDPLLTAVLAADDFEVLSNEIWMALPKFGAAALEPVLAKHDEATTDLDRAAFCALLGGLGVRDERVFTRMLTLLDAEPDLVAAALGEYGDPRALPHLHRCLDAHVLDASDPRRNAPVIELAFVIEQLGDELTEDQEDKHAEARRIARAHQERIDRAAEGDRPRPARRRERPGRNEPCWCGSGKKYKRCHLDADERSEREDAPSDGTDA